MANVSYTDLAKRDLAEIWRYIADDSPVNAHKFLEFIKEKCQMLAEVPTIGHEYPELSEGIYGFPVRNYMVFYEIRNNGIIIARVLNAKRDIPSLFH